MNLPLIPLRMTNAPFSLNLQVSMRWWSAEDMGNSEQRIVCSNRMGRKTLPWMGAIARGLNRHPISSVVDSGGISGVIASLFQGDKTIQKKDQLIQNLLNKVNNYEILEQRQQDEFRLCLEDNRLATSNMPLLAHHYTKLQAKYSDLEETHQEMTKKLIASKNFEAELIELKTKFNLLEEAHVTQAAYIQKAQREMQKLQVYKQTIATQENVIAKLEKLVDSKLAEVKVNTLGPNVHAEIFRLRLENSFLKEQTTHHIATANLNQTGNGTPKLGSNLAIPPLRFPSQVLPQDQLSKPQLPSITQKLLPVNQASTAEKAVNTEAMPTEIVLQSPPNLNTIDDSVLVVRMRVLEEQLRVVTTNAAQEIAQLKAALFEHEMGTVW
ncbi:hypothetical protein THRCLA_01333 [Thraustotheca clavata]|uniref:Uncharacterized protein n=1 Tax=Thraustotheca clavata TaxID=74557 RepID=A0A1W0A8Z7_9STRA|nr:hypothetical protein THRCLA_01333 [Thraustotheca clavata]